MLLLCVFIFVCILTLRPLLLRRPQLVVHLRHFRHLRLVVVRLRLELRLVGLLVHQTFSQDWIYYEKYQ